jgi:hypothetical protein
MQITVDIKHCDDCRHRDHSGAFTKGGAKPICSHSYAVEYATRNKTFPKFPVKGSGGDEKYHWRHRVLRMKQSRLIIPDWCPLKHGEAY